MNNRSAPSTNSLTLTVAEEADSLVANIGLFAKWVNAVEPYDAHATVKLQGAAFQEDLSASFHVKQCATACDLSSSHGESLFFPCYLLGCFHRETAEIVVEEKFKLEERSRSAAVSVRL